MMTIRISDNFETFTLDMDEQELKSALLQKLKGEIEKLENLGKFPETEQLKNVDAFYIRAPGKEDILKGISVTFQYRIGILRQKTNR